jgi:hypothetical protein
MQKVPVREITKQALPVPEKQYLQRKKLMYGKNSVHCQELVHVHSRKHRSVPHRGLHLLPSALDFPTSTHKREKKKREREMLVN